jgi:hypothetical protein
VRARARVALLALYLWDAGQHLLRFLQLKALGEVCQSETGQVYRIKRDNKHYATAR